MRWWVLTNFVALAICQTLIYHSPAEIDDVVVSGDTIYIGAEDSLAALSTNELRPLHNVSLGPIRDSQLCSADGKSCLRDVQPKLTHVRTKIFVVLPTGGILHCTSVRQGSCTTYSTRLKAVSNSSVPVAANDPAASTVVLVLGDKIVVAASSTPESPYRDPFPAVAVRTLPDLQVENGGDLDGEAAVYLRAAFRNAFRYVYAFRHEHFVFVVAVQTTRQNRLSSTTKLIRFCTNDTRFVSYSEIELQCRGEDNSNFPLLTSASLAGEKLMASFASPLSKRSLLCAFSMPRIKLTYWYNVDRCRGGTDSIRLTHIGRDAKCANKSHLPLDEDSCELGVGGSIEALEMALQDLNENVTSLLPVDNKVLFVGTATGQIIMMKWRDTELEEYGRKDVGDASTGAVVRKMVRVGDDVLIQLPNGIVKVEIASCSHHTSCGSCLVSADPLCQWCHPTATCSTPSKCSVPVSPICPEKEGNPTPDRISVNETALIVVPIRYLPPPSGFTYRCVFGDAKTSANWTESGVICQTASLPIAQSLRFAVSTSLSPSPIVSHEFNVYDCSFFKTCSQCKASRWGCEWCPSAQKCVRANSCPMAKATSCVRILPMKIPLAVGSEQEIVLEAENLQTLRSSDEHFCQVNIDGKVIKSRAKIASDSVRCGRMQLTTEHRQRTAANLSVPISLTAYDQIIDVANLSLYSCASLANDCSSCLALSPSLACGWCQGRCAHDCHHLKYTVCDPPKILHFEPQSGPVDGGTIVTIYGKDLGTSIEDVRGRVIVAGSRCDVIDYKVSNMIVCRVEKGVASGPVRISVGRVTMKSAESTSFYSFVEVAVFSAFPLFGPISGGTKLTMYGNNLDCGTNVSVAIGDSTCAILNRNSTAELTCLTPAASTIGKTSQIVLRFDRSIVVVQSLFEYRSDPVITNIYPHEAFRSGGRQVVVQGMSLDSVKSPRMYLVSSTIPPFHLVSELASCEVLNATTMTCNSPKVLDAAANKIDYTRFPVGFAMDNVTSVQNLGRRVELNIVPDPQVAPFKGVRIHQGEQPLILEGNHLNRAAEPHDFKVFIGSERCYVTLIDVKQLVCSSPVRQPAATDEKGQSITGSLPLVTVVIGRIRTEVGLIEYVDQNMTTRLWILASATATAMMFVLMALCVIWRRRRAERERDYRKIQMQMESLESNVRKECKQAFAELQTTLAPTTPTCADEPPLLPFSMFVENLLWSDSMATTTPTLGHTLPVTLAQFHALLSSKKFIFALVEVAESDMSMTPGERSMLSSLLISVLLRNFSYCTDVVVDLLRAHIAKTVHAKGAEMLFRKSDSVVEKMTAKWISICLHEHILPQIHEFFNLYKALKYQTEKGPVDAVTGAARYTINESKLLRESVDSSPISIRVAPLDGDEPKTVDVHACDAICQLKQKVVDVVYRSLPYNQRPALSQFDLQVKSVRGVMTLQDTGDGETQRKGPTKLRTVADYGITNGAFVQMTPASCRMECYRNSLADSGQSSWSSLDRCSPVYSPSQYYHLINPARSLTLDKRKKIDDSIPKSIPEVYLTRLLTSKGTVQTYVEDFLESVLYMEDVAFPPILKFFFDLLDREAATNGVSESICQQWKSNSYVLRIWANFLKNPRLLFDVADSPYMDANLSTIAQTLMDCFSFSEPALGAHSPSSRLLFAKDVARLRPLCSDLFRRIKRSPPLSYDAYRVEIANIANDVSTCKGSSVALSELLSWVRGNGIRVTEVLATDAEAISQRLPQRLSDVLNVCLEPEHIYSTISDYA